MEPNIGFTEFLVRIAGGIILLGYAVYGIAFSSEVGLWTGILVTASIILGVAFLLTAILRTCPINTATGLNTIDQDKEQ
ncbi:MAG: DUF2892 domain-containing protein [bacterium]